MSGALMRGTVTVLGKKTSASGNTFTWFRLRPDAGPVTRGSVFLIAMHDHQDASGRWREGCQGLGHIRGGRRVVVEFERDGRGEPKFARRVAPAGP